MSRSSSPEAAPSAPRSRTGALVVANADAGSHDDEALRAVADTLAPAFDVEVARTDGPEALDAALAALDGRLLVNAGGDGSLHAALQGLHAAGTLGDHVVGLVPLGTGNDFARGVGLPTDPVQAAARIRDGVPRPLDLLRTDDGEIVANAAHVGLGALAAEHAAALKGALGRLAYRAGALLAGTRTSGFALRIEVDGALVHDGEVALAGVANAPFIGGGTPLCPDARPDDGLLDVVIAAVRGPGARLAFAVALRQGRHTERDDVTLLRGRTVTISGEAVTHDVDGELGAPRSARTYRVAPAAWRLRC